MDRRDQEDGARNMAEQRKKWPDGPWNHEPDRVEWRSEHGFPCLILRSRLGALCGYVGLPPGHPMHGKEYGDVPVDVHGGLTYAEHCNGEICHVPAEGEPDDAYWLGFDCAHSQDIAPYMLVGGVNMTFQWSEYRSVAYVRAETERLAEQLAAMVTP
jgi:hypothetical protein